MSGGGGTGYARQGWYVYPRPSNYLYNTENKIQYCIVIKKLTTSFKRSDSFEIRHGTSKYYQTAVVNALHAVHK